MVLTNRPKTNEAKYNHNNNKNYNNKRPHYNIRYCKWRLLHFWVQIFITNWLRNHREWAVISSCDLEPWSQQLQWWICQLYYLDNLTIFSCLLNTGHIKLLSFLAYLCLFAVESHITMVWGFFFFFFFFLRSPGISLGFTTSGWDFCISDRFLIQPLR